MTIICQGLLGHGLCVHNSYTIKIINPQLYTPFPYNFYSSSFPLFPPLPSFPLSLSSSSSTFFPSYLPFFLSSLLTSFLGILDRR